MFDGVMTYLEFWKRMIQTAVVGSRRYYAWVGFLLILSAAGAACYILQLRDGLIVTNLSNHVSWGAYIANFTYLVGVLAVAVLLVVPAFLLNDEGFKEVVLLGQLLAFSVIVMCLLFINVDLGRPERFLHIMPIVGKMNFPDSILAWDVIVLMGYLALNFIIPTYLLYRMYRGQQAHKAVYWPFILLSLGWAMSIHTVSAFLYCGLGGRPHWNSAVLAPRFFVSAFACGPAILILVFKAIAKFTELKPQVSVFRGLRLIMTYTLLANVFLFGCEIFKEFYTGSSEVASLKYLLFGLHGKGMLRPYIWAAMAMEIAALIILFVPRLHKRLSYRMIACIFVVLGTWVEKGMGLIIPGFIPNPLGDLVEYTPSVVEFFISLGIWAFGAFLYTVFARICVAIQTGKVRCEKVSPQTGAKA